ncbi:PhoU domain-containing protein [Haloplanus ruber]|uniref:PhoU domain-containing protein n=1 Tax=Haloplanus ruber TaxID=869892 RepID=A0ABD6CW73_9EURY|nr:phosphate uptake regulator PhoU [Haloplanus ruber]
METRKLQKIGGSTYSVSLPKEWATEHRLEAGMPINLYPHTDGSLVVRRGARDGGPLGATELTPPDTDAATLRRALEAAYAVGYDTITLYAPDGVTFDATERRAVRRIADGLVGMSVGEAADDRITVDTLLDTGEVSIQQSVVQLQFTALSIHRAAVEALATPAEAERLDDRDDAVDRLFRMLTRHLNRSLVDFAEVDHLGVGRGALFDYYLVARQLERVADHAVDIAAVVDRADELPPPAVRDDLVDLGARSREVIETATAAVIESSTERAYAVLNRRDALVDDVRALDRALFERSPSGAYAVSQVLDVLGRTAACAGNVARVALRTDVRPED